MKRLAIVTTHPIQYNAPLFRLLAASSVLVFSVPRRQIVQSFKLKYGFGGTGGGKNQRIPHSAKEKKRGFGFWSIKKNRCTAFCLKKVAFFSGLVGETCPSFMYT